MPPVTKPAVVETTTLIRIDDTTHKVIEIRATGDVILDVSFENTNACTKSIPSDALQKLRTSKLPIPSPRVFYRVRLETLKKHSKYFAHLLGSDVFGEGRLIKDAFAELAGSNVKPSEVEVDRLPKIRIVDEDDATKTIGREAIFRDMLRIMHGAEHLTKPITMTYLSILVIMADRFDCLALVSRYVTGTFASFKYPHTLDRSTEESLRQKILIFYHTNQAVRLAAATKELVLRGSSRWVGFEDNPGFSTAWWDLPDGLETELTHRRTCILRTIASVQTHFLALYTSRTRQCYLGYDSSAACDSFQLGEMVKFLTKKDLLSLVPFQAVSPDDHDYVWPDAYTGDIENLIGLLRQCPGYQVDKNHSHCGLRSRILPSLKHIQDCIDSGIGIKVMRWKTDRSTQTWISSKASTSGNGRKPFMVGGEAVGEESGRTFDLEKAAPSTLLGANSLNIDVFAKQLFTAEKWTWTRKKEDGGLGLPKSSPSLKF